MFVTVTSHPEDKLWPYPLRNLVIDRPNQIWCADITHLPMRRGFLSVVTVMGWATRKGLVWWSMKYECVHLHAFETGNEARAGPGRWGGMMET